VEKGYDPVTRTAIRLAIGAGLGAAAWPALGAGLPVLPEWLRFLAAWFLFTAGPGIVVAALLARQLDTLRGGLLALGVGSAATPVVIDIAGHLGVVPLFPYFACACAGLGVAAWLSAARGARVSTSRGDLVACLGLLVLAAGIGAVVFGHRLSTGPNGIQLYGDYDSADLSYYAAEASEASHTVPPMASYYSGHKLNAAYYPHLVLAMAHRFADVPVLPMYFRYAWPTFVALGTLMAFCLVRTVAPRAVAVLASALVIAGSDFSYLAGWWLPHTNLDWDFVLWPTNFLSPTMHVLQFNTWGPSLPVFFTALYAIVRGLQTGSRGWLATGAFALAVLFEFKPFAYIVLIAAIGAAALFSGRDWATRWRLVGVGVLTAVFTVPLILDIFALAPGDRRSKLVIDFFLLPERMLIKTDLAGAFASLAEPVRLSLATALFLIVGVGVRWVGAPGVWRAIRHGVGPDNAAWRLLAWIVVAGLAIPFVLTTDPYVDTINFHLTGLYLMWVFAAAALVRLSQRGPRGLAVAALAVALTMPSTVHYLARKWTEAGRPPRAALSRSEVAIAEYLKQTDPELTVILHDRPLAPSLLTVVSERRIVLGWDVRYSAVGGEGRLADVNAFYASADGDPDAAAEILRRYKVTHVVVRSEGDRVHPDVLAGLQLVLRFPDVALYQVR
jgi:hypothetical protein